MIEPRGTASPSRRQSALRPAHTGVVVVSVVASAIVAFWAFSFVAGLVAFFVKVVVVVAIVTLVFRLLTRRSRS